MSTKIRVTFHGAAGTVTGSRHLVSVQDQKNDEKKILLDCGLFQGPKRLRLKNWEKPSFDPEKLDAVVLSHAHIDHTGYLPKLVQSGYKGPVYCTPATQRLLGMLLPDSAHLQEEEARFAAKHGTSKHGSPKPLYTSADAQQALKQLRTFERSEAFELFPGIHVTAECAGHILGSTTLSIEARGRRVLFSGDIGRYDTPILADPKGVPMGDLLLCESTYGNRLHTDADVRAELAEAVKASNEGSGPLIIPAFAIGRTQNLLYMLAELEREGKIPEMPVFVDSPMAIDATSIYREFKHDYDEDAQQLLRDNERPMRTAQTFFAKSVEESKRLNSLKSPAIIISASGMVTGGRILHHMKQWLPNPEASVLFVGYQAHGTRGRVIQSGAKDVKIFGQRIPVQARVSTISGLSAHGDRSELTRWIESCQGAPREIRAVHGEPEPAREFAAGLGGRFGVPSSAAEFQETVEVS